MWSQDQTVEVKSKDRPQDFICNAGSLIGRQGHSNQLKIQAKTLANLGFNTAAITENACSTNSDLHNSWKGLDLKSVDNILVHEGIKWRSHTVDLPLHDQKYIGSFDPFPDAGQFIDSGLTLFDFAQEFLKDRNSGNDLLAIWANDLRNVVKDACNYNLERIVNFRLADERLIHYSKLLNALDPNDQV